MTNRGTGPDADKPALWVDGNIHAAEVTASTACLYWLHRLASGYGEDRQTTQLLDTRVVYLVPRLNPDGAELALADRPRHIRSSTRPYPYDEEAVEGLTVEDIDGDGRVLTMRIPDPHGPYRKHPAEPRLMVAREPGEFGGEYYRLVPEGTLKNFDGLLMRVNPDREGLDLNRNFPAYWRQEFEQQGAGPYPTSEPEVRAMVDFVVRHPNIGAAVSFHTHSGMILRPMGTQSDDDARGPVDLQAPVRPWREAHRLYGDHHLARVQVPPQAGHHRHAGQMTSQDRMLILGATGFIGRRLLPELVKRGIKLRLLVRDPSKVSGLIPGNADIEVFEGDVLKNPGLRKTLHGIHTAYYFVHSLGGKSLVRNKEFAERDKDAAKNFVEAADDEGLKRVIYFGGLGAAGENLSEHLRSRAEVGSILASGKTAATILRAAVIIGAGGASFEMCHPD